MIRAGSARGNPARGGWAAFGMEVEDHGFVLEEARQIATAPVGELRAGRRALPEIIAVLDAVVCSTTRGGQRHPSTGSLPLARLAAG